MKPLKQRLVVAGIPLILSVPENPQAWVLFLHGAGGCKERSVRLAGAFNRRGLASAHPDAPLHGERSQDEWRFDRKDMANYIEGVARAIAAQVAELPALAAELAGLPQLAGLPMTAAGASMGGYVWHELISRELLRPKAVAILISSAYPLDVPHDFVSKYPELRQAYQNPPAKRAAAYPPTPILHLHGQRDPIVPLKRMQDTIAALEPYYSEHDGRLAQAVFAGVGHELPAAMLEQAAAWLEFWGV